MNTTPSHLLIGIFLCGDVMTGRGIDQILPHPGEPRIHEPYVRDARKYAELAERVHGPIPRPAGFSYVWGDALAELERLAPDVRIINLETSITKSDDYWKGKGINYRMNPENIHVITAAGIDACSLANNHVLDWGYDGLAETLQTLRMSGVKFAGAGLDLAEAKKPAVIEVKGKGRVIMFSFGLESSGISVDWAAAGNRPGVNLVDDLSDGTVEEIKNEVLRVKRTGDCVVASIHWGGNWGYEIPPEQTRFAHSLVDKAGVDVIHGHSSHHAKGIEVYRGKPIIYGCGDFINDYEGIAGYESFRGDLSLMYFVRMDPTTGELIDLLTVPMCMNRFRLNRASQSDTAWLRDTLNREGTRFGARVEMHGGNTLVLRWK